MDKIHRSRYLDNRPRVHYCPICDSIWQDDEQEKGSRITEFQTTEITNPLDVCIVGYRLHPCHDMEEYTTEDGYKIQPLENGGYKIVIEQR